jgi:hypothetical protein
MEKLTQTAEIARSILKNNNCQIGTHSMCTVCGMHDECKGINDFLFEDELDFFTRGISEDKQTIYHEKKREMAKKHFRELL